MADRYDYPGEAMWYVAHTYSGYENKVKANLDKSIQNLGMENQILEVLVPMEEVEEVKDGQRRLVQKKLFPGYVLVHMFMNDDTWYVVRNTRGVTGFVGPESSPVPLTEEEMKPFGISIEGGGQDLSAVEGKRVSFDIEEGDRVQVIAGAWDDREGIVREVNHEKMTVKVGFDMFGRETAVEVSFYDVKKIG